MSDNRKLLVVAKITKQPDETFTGQAIYNNGTIETHDSPTWGDALKDVLGLAEDELFDGLTNPAIVLRSPISGVVATTCTAYNRHGESYEGNLLVIEYKHMIEKPSAFNFGKDEYSESVKICLNNALTLFGQWSKKHLAIPEIVLEYPEAVSLKEGGK